MASGPTHRPARGRIAADARGDRDQTCHVAPGFLLGHGSGGVVPHREPPGTPSGSPQHCNSGHRAGRLFPLALPLWNQTSTGARLSGETPRKRRLPLAPPDTKKLESLEYKDFSPSFSWQAGGRGRRAECRSCSERAARSQRGRKRTWDRRRVCYRRGRDRRREERSDQGDGRRARHRDPQAGRTVSTGGPVSSLPRPDCHVERAPIPPLMELYKVARCSQPAQIPATLPRAIPRGRRRLARRHWPQRAIYSPKNPSFSCSRMPPRVLPELSQISTAWWSPSSSSCPARFSASRSVPKVSVRTVLSLRHFFTEIGTPSS